MTHLGPIRTDDRVLAALLTERDAHAAAMARLDKIIADLRGAVSVVAPAPRPRRMTVKRRFTDLPEAHPEHVVGLVIGHPALVEERTLFPSTVVAPADSPRLLVSGEHNRKLGDRIVKGPWRGLPIFHLTLEERATCPSSCSNWSVCYGNAMQRARRHSTVGLTARLRDELTAMMASYRQGIAVRLHTLGDFYSVDYVAFWAEQMTRHAGLRLFGYTARDRGSDIGAAVARLNRDFAGRCLIRFSDVMPAPGGAVTIFRKPEGATVAEGIVCPAERGATDCCGSCGLCWHPAAADKTIVFVAHGLTKPSVTGGATVQRVYRKAAEVDAAILEALRGLTKYPGLVNGIVLQQRTGIPRALCLQGAHRLVAAGKVLKYGDRRATDFRASP